MRGLYWFLGCLLLVACQNNSKSEEPKPIAFDASKWQEVEEGDYRYRSLMYREVLYHDTIRNSSQAQIKALLGAADRQQDGYWYYRINQEKMGNFPLHTRTLVIKWVQDTISWIKLHE